MARASSDLVVPSNRQVREYDEQGCLSLDRLTSEAEVTALCEIYDRLFEPGAAVADSDRVELSGTAERSLPQILNPDHYAPELLETEAYRSASAVARQLLGEQVEHMGMHATRKSPRSAVDALAPGRGLLGPGVPPPGAEHLGPPAAGHARHGCMHFVPGSHRGEVRPHQLIDPRNADGLRLTDGQQVEGGVACPLPPGGATVHAGRTLHYTGAHHSDEPRRALIMASRTPPVWVGTRSFPWQPAAWYE